MNSRKNPVVLIVDDEPPIRQLVRKIMEASEWVVLEARDGGEALHLLATVPHVDFLVTDLQMPVMDGKQLAQTVRLLRPRLKVLYLTGYSEMLFTSAKVLTDNEAYLDKPFTPKALIEAVSLLFFGTLQPAGDTRRPWASRLLAAVHPRQLRMLRERGAEADDQAAH